MIDVHTHILPFIDDGADELEKSFSMIKDEIAIHIKDIILTPHALRYNLNKYSKSDLLTQFHDFYNKVKSHFDVNLFLGQEITYQKNMISLLKKDELFSMNNSPYILLELPYYEEIEDFDEIVFNCKVLGYKIVVAHVERYEYYNYSKLEELKSYGVLFQVNSKSITGKSGKLVQKLVLKLFKQGYVDFVGSDVHSFRLNDMDIAYQIITDKFGSKTAEDVFTNNAKIYFNIK